MPPPKIRGQIFFGQESCEIRNFVNFSYIFFGQKCAPLKFTDLLRLCAVIGCNLHQNANDGGLRAATVVQVLQNLDLF